MTNLIQQIEMTPLCIEEEERLRSLFLETVNLKERLIMGSERFLCDKLFYSSPKGVKHNIKINELGGGCVALEVQGVLTSDINEVYFYEIYLKAWEAVTDNNGDGFKYRTVYADNPISWKLRNYDMSDQCGLNLMVNACPGLVILSFDGTNEQKIDEASRKIELVRDTMEKMVSAKNGILETPNNKGIETDPISCTSCNKSIPMELTRLP